MVDYFAYNFQNTNWHLKNRVFISLLFGLFVIIVLSFQMINTLVNISIENDTIELSELNDYVEEKEDHFEEVLFYNSPNQYKNNGHVESCHFRLLSTVEYKTIFIKIPFPPPELAEIIS